jgi:NAD+ synthase (glutamine-hydrolysing)
LRGPSSSASTPGMDSEFGFVRMAAVSPPVCVANPKANVDAILSALAAMPAACDVVVFPELCVTGYTCGDLFRQVQLLHGAEREIARLAASAVCKGKLVLVGAPIAVGNELFNCAVVIGNGRVLGAVPKTHIPNYFEFYESRHFRSARGDESQEIQYAGQTVPFGVDLLFRLSNEAILFAEICEDLWMPIPPSSHAAIAGATLLVNLSASNETVAKNEYRTELVRNQSGRCMAAYVYASAGPGESTSDVVYGGHCLICENGSLLSESARIGDGRPYPALNQTIADIDVQRLLSERRATTSFGDASPSSLSFRVIDVEIEHQQRVDLLRHVAGRPFVPSDPAKLAERCAEVFGIACAGLAKRLSVLPFKNVYIGVSGGLDSTLALLTVAKVYEQLGRNPSDIVGITMPGFGTSDATLENALTLMQELGVTTKTIDIRAICLETFRAIGHAPFGIAITPTMTLENFVYQLRGLPNEPRSDLVFENVQARERTKILMSHGFVIGTGDLSELALGWCTYNGDHMSMYNPNCSIPKTLVRFLIEYVASQELREQVRQTLMAISKTIISPELLPLNSQGEITQSTEETVGPYELHDFFLHGFLRCSYPPKKLLHLARFADFSRSYDADELNKWLKVFLRRFFSNQFKRNCVPDGPKVGSVSLSPRGDWRMPSDADVGEWLKGLE